MSGANDPNGRREPARPRWQTRLGVTAGLATPIVALLGIAANLGKASAAAVLAVTAAATVVSELFRRYAEHSKNDEQ